MNARSSDITSNHISSTICLSRYAPLKGIRFWFLEEEIPRYFSCKTRRHIPVRAIILH